MASFRERRQRERNYNERYPNYEMRSINLDRTLNRRRNSLQLQQIQTQRRYFHIKVYAWAAVCICLTFAEWMIIILEESVVEFIKDNYYITFIATIVLLILTSVFTSFIEIRYVSPCKWIFIFAIVQLTTFGLLLSPIYATHCLIAICFVVTIAVNVSVILISNLLPADLTVIYVQLMIVHLVVYIVMLVYYIVSICTDIAFPTLYFAGIMMILTLMNIAVYAQLISGTRSYVIPLYDNALAVLVIYFLFTIFNYITIFVADYFYEQTVRLNSSSIYHITVDMQQQQHDRGYKGRRTKVKTETSLGDRMRRKKFVVMLKQRKYFIQKVYLLAAVCICLTFLQWMIVKLNESIIEFFKDNNYITFIATILFTILMTVFTLIDAIRYNPPYNWIFGFYIVEFTTFGLLLCPLYTSYGQLVMCFLATIATVVPLILSGVLLRADLTVITTPLMVVHLFLYVVAMITYIVYVSIGTDEHFPGLYFVGVMMVLMSINIAVYAQLISGTRTYYYFRFNDYTLAVLVLYFLFTVFYSVIIFVSSYKGVSQ